MFEPERIKLYQTIGEKDRQIKILRESLARFIDKSKKLKQDKEILEERLEEEVGYSTKLEEALKEIKEK